MGGIYNLLNQMRFRRALGMPSPETSPEVIEEPEEDLYADPRSLDAYRQHAMNPPTRESAGPEQKDRVLMALSTFFQGMKNPGFDQNAALQKMLDRPYQNALQEHEVLGEGLRTSVGLEESSLNRKRLGKNRQEEIAARRAASDTANEDRDLERERRSEESNIRADDRDADRLSREEMARENREDRAEGRRESASLRREIAGNKPVDEKGWTIQKDDQGGFTRINNRTGEVKPVEGAKPGVSPKENERRGLLKGMRDDLQRIKTLSEKKSSQIGPADAIWEGVKRKTTGTDNDMEDIARTTENLSDMLVRARSGAQINEHEYQRLKKLVPDKSMPFKRFQQNVDLFINELDAIMENTVPGDQGIGKKRTVGRFQVEEG